MPVSIYNAMMLLPATGLNDLVTKAISLWNTFYPPIRNICAVIFGFMAIFFAIKAIAGDEQDVKQSIKRVKTCIVVLLVVCCLPTILTWIIDAMGITDITFGYINIVGNAARMLGW